MPGKNQLNSMKARIEKKEAEERSKNRKVGFYVYFPNDVRLPYKEVLTAYPELWELPESFFTDLTDLAAELGVNAPELFEAMYAEKFEDIDMIIKHISNMQEYSGIDNE